MPSAWKWLTMAVFLLSAVLATPAMAQRFVLEIPGAPSATSTAVLEGRQLQIVTPEGRRFVYQRQADLDTQEAGERLFGFYCEQADQYVLWPAGGTGPMWIGTAIRGKVNWHQSKMRARPVPPAAGVGPPAQPGAVDMPRDAGQAPPPAGPMAAAVFRQGDVLVVARIDTGGHLHFYQRRQAAWHHTPATVATGLVPGAPLLLLADGQSELPRVYTVSTEGNLIEIAGGTRLRIVSEAPGPVFVPGTHLATLGSGETARAYAVDRHRRLWELDLIAGRHRLVDSTPGMFDAGVPLAAVESADHELFLIDVRGNIVRYVYSVAAGRWSAAQFVSGGFLSGGSVTARFVHREDREGFLYIAAVATDGHCHVLSSAGRRWSSIAARQLSLPPGIPLAAEETTDTQVFSMVQTDGTWVELQRQGGSWQAAAVAEGFPVGTAVATASADEGFAVDATGKLVAAARTTAGWQWQVLIPGDEPAPRLEDRLVRDGSALPPVTATLVNTHQEELLVRIYDVRNPGKPVQHTIKPGQSVRQVFHRDPGGEMVETHLVHDALGHLVQQEYVYPIPPQVLYTAVVHLNRVTSRYIDARPNKPANALPDFANRSLVSLGVFPIPPGDLLRQGQQIDVYGQAKNQRNPGATAWFGTARRPN